MKRRVTNKQVGAKLRAAREAAGLTQAALGKKLGILFQTVAKREKGTSSLKLTDAIRTADAIGCPLSDLVP